MLPPHTHPLPSGSTTSLPYFPSPTPFSPTTNTMPGGYMGDAPPEYFEKQKLTTTTMTERRTRDSDRQTHQSLFDQEKQKLQDELARAEQLIASQKKTLREYQETIAIQSQHITSLTIVNAQLKASSEKVTRPTPPSFVSRLYTTVISFFDGVDVAQNI